MSQQQQSSSSSKNTYVITNVDSLLGYAMAYRFLEGLQGQKDSTNKDQKIRLLCRSRSGYGISRLEKMGGEVCEINYKDEDKLCQALKNVCAVLFIPEFTSESHKEAECLLKAAKKQDVEHLGMISCIGVNRIEQEGQSSEFQMFKQLHRIEKLVKEQFNKNHCITRCGFFSQFLYFMAPVIERDHVLSLPVKKDKRWTNLDMNDVIEGVWRLCMKQHERQSGESVDAFYNKQEYEFACSKPNNGEEMAREICQGLELEQVKYEEMSEQDMKKYLMQMQKDKRFQERPDEQGDFRKGRDGFWSFPINKFLHEHKIQFILEFWQLANKGLMETGSKDLSKILEREPRTLKQYFEVNRDQFKRLK